MQRRFPGEGDASRGSSSVRVLRHKDAELLPAWNDQQLPAVYRRVDPTGGFRLIFHRPAGGAPATRMSRAQPRPAEQSESDLLESVPRNQRAERRADALRAVQM